MNNRTQALLASGALLFFLGLLSGFAIPALTNPRMGGSSHLEGLMNGTFLMVVGLAWNHLNLSDRWGAVAYWALLYGAYANWIFVQLAGIFGTAAMAPIAGAGQQGQVWQEALVTGGLLSVGLVMVVAGAILVWGFFRGPTAGNDIA